MDFLACLRKWTRLKRNCYVDGLFSLFAQMDTRKRNCCADGLFSLFMNTSNQNAVITQAKRAKQNAKPLILTMPILNAGLGFYAKVCVYL